MSYGTIHTQADIDAYRSSGNVPTGLGRNLEGHGTHVASIAAGRQSSAFYGGVAPDAKLLIVPSKISVAPGERVSLGYSNSHVDALQYIKSVAERLELPVVVNVSQGMNAGAHDGTSLLEAAFDEFSAGGREPGFIVVKSAGNERGHDGHAKVQIGSNSLDKLIWDSQTAHTGPDVIELWFNGSDQLRFRIVNPRNEISNWVGRRNPVESGMFKDGNKYRMDYMRFHEDNGDGQLLISVWRGSGATIATGSWTLEIESSEVKSNGVIHAWIEREDRRHVRFASHVNEEITLSISGTARSVISVASIGSSAPPQVASYSSWGPTRDGRDKPDVAAPGEQIVAAKSDTTSSTRSSSGTSMAAPHVTGTIALLLSYMKKQQVQYGSSVPNAAQIRAALTQMTQNFNGRHVPAMGYGALNARALVEAFQ